MFNFSFINDFGNYEQRKVGRIEPEDNGGVGVSTAYSSDEGYETALLDARGVHPVERYPDKSTAATGHLKWVNKAKKMKEGETVRKIFWSDMPDMDKDISIEPVTKGTV